MSSDQMGLHLDLTADSSGASRAIEDLNARLSRLEQIFNRSSSGATKVSSEVEKVGSAATKASRSIEQHTGVLSKLSQVAEDFGRHQRTVSMGFGAMGLKADAAAAKIDGFTQLLRGMSGAVPMLLGVGVAATAAFAAFGAIKDSIGVAGAWQHSMALLGQTVKDQGGNWTQLKDKVEEWAEVQEKTTEYSRKDAVDALTRLTSTGMSLSDAMKVTRVAEDAAAATGRSLTDVNFALSEAMHGRTQALTQLGIGTRASIKEGMAFKDVLKAIESHMGGAAATAADTYSGKVAQLHNTWQELEENVGTVLLPYLTKIVGGVLEGIEIVERFGTAWADLGRAFEDVGANIVTIAERVAQGITHALEAPFKALGDALHGNFSGAQADLAGAFSGGMQSGGLRSAGAEFANLFSAAPKNAADIGGLSSGLANTMVGGAGAHGGGSGKIAEHTVRVKDLTSALARQAEALDKVAQKNREYMLSLSALDEKADNATNARTLKMNIDLAFEDIHLREVAAEAAKRAEEAAKRQAEEQQRAYEKMISAATQWSDKTAGFIESLFERGKHHTNAFKTFFQSFLKDLETSLLKSALFSMFTGGKGNAGAVFGSSMQAGAKSNPLLGALSMFANMGGGGKGAHGAAGFLAPIESIVGGSGGGALTGGGAITGSGGIIGALIGSAAATQLASSLPTDSLMSMLFGVGAPSAPGGGIGSGAGGGGGLGGALPVVASAAGPGGGTILGTAAQIGSASSALGLGGIGGIGGLLGKQVSLYGVPTGTTVGSMGLGALGGYLVGTGIGATVYGNQPYNSGAKIGGTIGGAVGTIFGPVGSAIGAVGGSLIGGLFGNHDNPANMPDKYNTTTFGQTIANLTGAGGQQYWQTDPTAPKDQSFFGANGQDFTSQIGSLTGGMSGVGFIEQTLSKYANADGSPGPNTPSWLLPLWGQLVPAFGISSTGSGQFNFAHNIGQNWVTGAQGASGSQMSYTQFGDLLDKFLQNYQTQGSVGSSPYTPVTNPNNPNNPGFFASSPFTGSYVVGTPGSAPTLNQGGVPLPSLDIGGGIGAGMSPGSGSMVPITVNVTVQGSVTSEGDLARRISEELARSAFSSPGIRGHV